MNIASRSQNVKPAAGSLNNTSLGNVSGKTGYIRFELTHPGAGIQLGVDRVYIDDVRLLGVGLPLQTESMGVTTSHASPQVAQAGITLLIEAARLQWEGLVQAPEGIGGTTLGLVGITATDLSLENGTGTSLEYSETYRDARGSEGGFNDQLFSTNTNFLVALNSQEQQPASDEIGLNSNAPFTSDSHTVTDQCTK